tara:strand:- start:3822 stop:5384 length:1563 start_codon:yes stop_codon:yes gene_type:complete
MDKPDRLPYGLVQIMGYSCITIFLVLAIIVIFIKRILSKNWEKHRCNNFVIPLTSFIKPEINAQENETYCFKKDHQPIMEEITFNKLTTKIEDTQKDQELLAEKISESEGKIQNVQKKTDAEVSVFYKAFERLKNINFYILKKIQNFFLKIGAIIWTIYFQLITQINIVLIQIASLYKMLSVMNSLAIIIAAIGIAFAFPPAAILSAIILAILIDINVTAKAAEQKAYCCFSETSLFLTQQGIKKIKDIKLGSFLDYLRENQVLGIVELKSHEPNIKVFDLTEDNKTSMFVTGDHLIYTNKSWKSIEEYAKSNKKTIPYKYTDTLISLVTTNNLLVSPNYYFKDYEETNHPGTQMKISEFVMNYLNPTEKLHYLKELYEIGEIANCLSPETKVLMEDNTYKKIKDIKIHDITSNGIVFGIYKCIGNKQYWFKLTDTENSFLASKVICKKKTDTLWKKIYNQSQIKHDPNFEFDIGYHLITETHTIQLENDYIIRDFIETNDDFTQSQIEKYVRNSIIYKF